MTEQIYRHCEPTDAIKNIIRKMAENRLKAGYEGAHNILDVIHAEIGEHTALTKSQIAGIIQESAAGRKYTKSELTARKQALKKELAGLYPPEGKPTPEQRKNDTRRKQIQKSLEEIDRKIKDKDFSGGAKNEQRYDEETLNLQRKLDKARNNWNRQLERWQYEQENPVIKAARFAVAVRRFSLLSGIPILWKLGSAVMARAITYPVESAVGSAIKHIPGLKQIADMAPREGKGWNTEAEVAAAKATFAPETFKEAWRKLSGESNRKTTVSTEHETIWPLLELTGRAHGAIKTFLEMNEAARSNVLRAEHMRKQLAAKGMSPIEIDAEMAKPSTQAVLYGQTINDGLRAILQSKNSVSNALNGIIRQLENPSKKASHTSRLALQAAGHGLDALIPIRGVPVNIVNTLTDYLLGAPKAIAEIGLKKREAIQRSKAEGKQYRVADTLTPDEADAIMRSLKQQPVGLAFMGLGALLGSAVGGFYEEGKKRKPTDLPYESLNLSGAKNTEDLRGLSDRQLLQRKIVPANLNHHFPGMLMQFGALIGETFEQEHGGASGSKAAALAALKELWGEMPFVSPVSDVVKGKFNPSRFAAESLVPQIVNNVAQWTDTDERGATIKRYPHNTADEFKQRIPVLREQVPTTRPERTEPYQITIYPKKKKKEEDK